MSNPNFTPDYSTNWIYRNQDTTRCLTDDLDAMDESIAALNSGKAPLNHEHTGYASSDHTHTGFAATSHTHTEYAASDHTHSGYAASDHTHTEYAPASHTHTGFAAENHTHTGYAPATHTHDYAPSDHTHTGFAAENHTHTGYAAASHTHDYAASSHSHAISSVTGLQDALDGKAASAHTHNYAASGHNHDTAYAPKTHTHDYAASGHNHDSAYASKNHTHTGFAASDHSHSYNDLSDKPSIPAAYTHPSSHPASMITGLATVATSGKYSDLIGKPTIPTIPSSLPANGGNADTLDNKHASDFAAASHTHNYAASGHNHDTAYFSKSGGTINGDTNVDGVLRVKSNQAYYYSSGSATQTIGSNNATGGTTLANGSNANMYVNGANLMTPNCLPRTTGTYYCGNSNYRWKGIYSAAAVNVSSDERLKRNIIDLDATALAAFINGLKVKSFNYKDDAEDEDARIGLIAQDVQRVNPEIARFFVKEDEDGMLGLLGSDLVFPAIAALQEANKRIEALERKVEELESKR